jgi:hypothetical protein
LEDWRIGAFKGNKKIFLEQKERERVRERERERERERVREKERERVREKEREREREQMVELFFERALEHHHLCQLNASSSR